jgi:hypothetical protein
LYVTVIFTQVRNIPVLEAHPLSVNHKYDGLAETIISVINESSPRTVKQLVSLVKNKLALPEDQVLNAVLRLQSEGKIRFETRTLALGFSEFMTSNYSIWYWSTVAFSLITVFLIFLIEENLYPWIYFRNLFGVVFVLWTPGYTFTKALFPEGVSVRESSRTLETVERIALSVVMSLALISVMGLLLNYSPWGIRLVPIVLSLLASTLIFGAAGVIREYRAKKNSYEGSRAPESDRE